MELLPTLATIGFLIVLFLGLYFLGFYLFFYTKKPKITYVSLLIWTFLGFFTTVDFTQDYGCIRGTEPIFSIDNMFYSGSALLFLSIGYFSSKNIGVLVLVGELLFWVYKLFLVKGGYAVGFGGTPDDSIVLFDTLALTLRLILIKQIKQIPIQNILALALAIGIMAIKIYFFRLNLR